MNKVIKWIQKYPNFTLVRGFTFFLTSYYPYLFDESQRSHFIVLSGTTLLYLGIIEISDYITVKYGNISLKNESLKNKRTIKKMLILGFVFGIAIDGFFQWLGKFWFYPFWNNSFYMVVFAAGFAFYLTTLAESYLAAKILLDKFVFKGKRIVTKSYKFESKIYRILFIISLGLLSSGLMMMILNYTLIEGYQFSITQHTEINITLSTVGIFLSFFGLLGLSEFILFKRGKVSFYKTLLHGYYTPTIAVLLSSFVIMAIMESQNGPLLLWHYVNVPLQEIKVFSMPILGVIGWPFHYTLLINLYKIIFQNDEKYLLGGDRFE